MIMNIFLLGYMGAGKSFFGKALSEYLSLPNFDLDLIIEKDSSMSIDKIFKDFGENYFRSLEEKKLSELINNYENYIVSCGGGTPYYSNNLNKMNKHGITIYLKRNPDYLYEYLSKSKSKRPIFSSLANKENFVLHFEQREFVYLQSKIIIDCDNYLSNSEIVENIKNQLNDYRFKK
tara:strand:- start:461 stop:991 length:531 start_codon:yes stop_codon:yes gene_type:complete